jgi:pseudouridine kinase
MNPVICIGAALVDELFHAHRELLLATTNNALLTKTAGGVSRNIAHQLGILGVPVQLISVFGDDADGDWLKRVCNDAGVGTEGSLTINGLTGKYTGILEADGSLHTAFLTNAAIERITPDFLKQKKELLETASYLVVDANISTPSVAWLLEFSQETGIDMILEPVSVPPARKFKEVNLRGLHMITPNEDELPAVCADLHMSTQEQLKELFNRGVEQIWLHKGKSGSALYSKEKAISLHAPYIEEVVDCTGAGDGSLSGYILGKFLGKQDLDCMKLAHTLSAEILQVNGAIAKHLTQESLMQKVTKYFPH